jgi:hypothetical protein
VSGVRCQVSGVKKESEKAVTKKNYVERIGENTGAENSRARAAMADKSGIGCVWLK